MGFDRFVAKLFGKKAPMRAPLPEAESRDYSFSELADYDGSDPTKPLLIGIRGYVYDVTRGRDFYGPGGPYGMFAGKDCTRALAKVSFDEELFTGTPEGSTRTSSTSSRSGSKCSRGSTGASASCSTKRRLGRRDDAERRYQGDSTGVTWSTLPSDPPPSVVTYRSPSGPCLGERRRPSSSMTRKSFVTSPSEVTK